MISAFKHMGLSIKNLTHGVRHPRQVTQVVVLALYDIAISEGVNLSNEIGEKLYSILSPTQSETEVSGTRGQCTGIVVGNISILPNLW